MHKLLLSTILVLSAIIADAQRSWFSLPDTGLFPYYTGNFVRYDDIYFTDTMNGFAVNLGGYLFKTTDGGRNWTNPLNRAGTNMFRSLEFLDDKSTGICGGVDTSESVFLTTDKGLTWTNIGSRIPDTLTIPLGKRTMCGITHIGNTFLGTGAWMTRSARFYKSTDKGSSWSVSYLDTTLITGGIDICFTSKDTGFISGGYEQQFPVAKPSKCVVLKTTDGGTTWKRTFYADSVDGRLWKLQAITPSLIVGSIEPSWNMDLVRMIKSTDGGETWRVVNTGFKRSSAYPPNATVQGIGFADSLHGWIGGYFNGMYETTDGGATWTELTFGANLNRFFILDSNHVYAGGHDVYFFGKGIPEYRPTSAGTISGLPHKLSPVRPNPSHGPTRINFELLSDTYVALEVMSANGQQSWSLYRGWLKKGRHEYIWDGTSAAAGNYVVWLGTNEIPMTAKFTLLH